jgi:hypothetical protein
MMSSRRRIHCQLWGVQLGEADRQLTRVSGGGTHSSFWSRQGQLWKSARRQPLPRWHNLSPRTTDRNNTRIRRMSSPPGMSRSDGCKQKETRQKRLAPASHRRQFLENQGQQSSRERCFFEYASSGLPGAFLHFSAQREIVLR